MSHTLRDALLKSAYRFLGNPDRRNVIFIQKGSSDDLLSAYRCILTLDSQRIMRDERMLVMIYDMIFVQPCNISLKQLLLHHFLKHTDLLPERGLYIVCLHICDICEIAFSRYKMFFVTHRQEIKRLCTRAFEECVIEGMFGVQLIVSIIIGRHLTDGEFPLSSDPLPLLLDVAILFDRYDLFNAFTERMKRSGHEDAVQVCYARMHKCRCAARCIQRRWRAYQDRRMRRWIARACHANGLSIGYVIYEHSNFTPLNI